MRDGNVTGSVNAPVPAFTAPFPSMIGPAQSTVTVREKFAMLYLRFGSNNLSSLSRLRCKLRTPNQPVPPEREGGRAALRLA
jgi:hypothetical protein